MENDIKIMKNQLSHLCVAMAEMTKYASSIFERLGEHDVLLNSILGKVLEINLEHVGENGLPSANMTSSTSVTNVTSIMTSRPPSPSIISDCSTSPLTVSQSSPSIVSDVTPFKENQKSKNNFSSTNEVANLANKSINDVTKLNTEQEDTKQKTTVETNETRKAASQTPTSSTASNSLNNSSLEKVCTSKTTMTSSSKSTVTSSKYSLSPFSSPKSKNKQNRHVTKKQKASCDSGIFSDDVTFDDVSEDVIIITHEIVDKVASRSEVRSNDKKQIPTCDVKIEINSTTSDSDVTDKNNGAATKPAEMRRNSFSGISLRSHQNNEDQVLVNKRSSSTCDMTSVGNTPKSDAGDTCADRRLFKVGRQFSNTSTSSAPGGINIVIGAESESDDDDIEKKLPDLPPCKFSHRQVQVKSSTYKHFYELKEAIGGGRFGRVHRCVEKKTGLSLAAKLFQCKKPVAKSLLKSKSLKRATQNLKTKRTNQEPVDKDDVMMEISIMNQIDHENIVKLYDAYENDNTMTLILEYLGGGELFERVLMDQSQLTELDAVLFMRQIVKAVQYLHKNLILHLDLKPENILCLDRSTHHLKIIDFGLARKYIPRHKLIVQWGTPEFMAPEVLNYDVVSFPSDMWSLGVICFILLSGMSPFLGEDDAETMENISDCEWNFDDFDSVSDQAKDFISRLLVEEKSGRMSAAQCLRHEWLSTPLTSKRRKALINKSQLKNFMARMHWKASIAAVSAANWLRLKVKNDHDDTAV